MHSHQLYKTCKCITEILVRINKREVESTMFDDIVPVCRTWLDYNRRVIKIFLITIYL